MIRMSHHDDVIFNVLVFVHDKCKVIICTAMFNVNSEFGVAVPTLYAE